MTKTLKNGDAKINRIDGGFIRLSWMGLGSDLIGEQVFGDHSKGWNAALRYCRLNALRVVEAA